MKDKTDPIRTRMSRGTKRIVADRQQILSAARDIGVRLGWKSVTIRTVAQRLGYTAPVLYQHFRDKQEILTELAIEGMQSLNRALQEEAPSDSEPLILVLAQRYWSFMLDHTQIYRLMNGMDGVWVDRASLAHAAKEICQTTANAIKQWLPAATRLNASALADEVWALLHGMASLHLDRAARFDLQSTQHAVSCLLTGAVHLATVPKGGAPQGSRLKTASLPERGSG